ncbi:acetyltransferase [Radiobacillus kanasensis]|uniref:acetyltransferase n=1 Tax=Radiobacillus kanasensis TaxID=2844358 RepID=UPI001E4EF86B|nr:acetyltransferase [Radiobacillus kanasensis]UFT98885.1 acetyltransferase [Radiobacillus kanasensis]
MYILIGAGGHSKVVVDILIAQNKSIIGFVDDNAEDSFLNYPILGKIEDMDRINKAHPSAKYLITIGNNELREKILKNLYPFNISFGEAIHPSAQLGSNVQVGVGTVIMPSVVVNHSSKIGNHAILNTGSTVDHDCDIGDYVHISPGVHLAGNVKIRMGTHIGIGSNVIQGIVIGERTVVGGGSVVIRNIDDHVVAVGVPVKIIKKRLI